MLIVAGIRVHRDQVLALAAMLTAMGRIERDASCWRRSRDAEQFVALTLDDRERILDALAHPPIELSDLRGALFDELNWRRQGLARPSVRADRSRRRPTPGEQGKVAWV